MALFTQMAAGSGVLSPIFPDLKFRFSVDGFGEVYEDIPNGFLLVWNADMVDRAIEYAPGLFTPVIVAHTGHLVSPGIDAPSLRSFPLALAAEWEKDRHPISIIDWPANYNRWQYDISYNTHTTGDSRRSITWPPLRALYHSIDQPLRDSAWSAMKSWCVDQLCRPLSSISAPFTPPVNIDTCGGQWAYNKGSSREWGYDDQVTRADQTGVLRNWNSFDPPHNESGPQFALACADGRLGVVLIWMLFRWSVQGAPPTNRCSNSSYSVPFDQERGIKWLLDLCLHAFMVGIEWADPNLIRDWCGGLDGKNGGLGFKPRESLRAYFERLVGPEYGGTGGASSRYHWKHTKPFPGDGHYQPYLGATNAVCSGQGQCNTNFQYNGKSYGRLFGTDKAFHRYMLLTSVPRVISAHDYLQGLDPSDPLLDPARVSEARRYQQDLSAFVIETGMHGAWSATTRGRFRQRTHVFDYAANEKGFESFDAVNQAILDAIACNPLDCDGSGNDWVYPGTDPTKRWHVFAVQHARWAPGAGLWHIHTGVFSESEAAETGPPGYAAAFGFDADLDAIIDANNIPQGSLFGGNYWGKASTASHYDIVWRAVEKATVTVVPVVGPRRRRSTTPATVWPGVLNAVYVASPARRRRSLPAGELNSGTSQRFVVSPTRRRVTRSDLVDIEVIEAPPPPPPPPPPAAPPRPPRIGPGVANLDVGFSVVGREGAVDLGLVGGDLQLERGLLSAVMISLFSDGRAQSGDALPAGEKDPRGWWADSAGDRLGSRLWLALDRAKLTGTTLVDVETYAREALSWLVRDGIARAVQVRAARGEGGRLELNVEVRRGRAARWQGLWAGEEEAVAQGAVVRVLTR